MVDDIIEITTTRRIKKESPIKRIYEYEENTEVLIINSKPKEEEERRSKRVLTFAKNLFSFTKIKYLFNT